MPDEYPNSGSGAPDEVVPGLADRRPWGLIRRMMGRVVPDDVWHNWRWDAAAAVFAGIYQGAVWTFALQLARGALHATGPMMALATAAPAIGVLFSAFWARQMEGKSKLPFVSVTWLIARGMFMFTPLLVRGIAARPAFVGLICVTPIIFSVSVPAYTFVMQDIYPDRLRGRLMSYVRIALAGSTLLSAALMGVLQQKGIAGHHLDYRWMFAIGGACGAISAVAFQQLKIPPVHHTFTMTPFGKFFRETYGVLVHNRGYRWFTISVFVSGFGNLVASTYYPIYQVDRFHITPMQIAGIQNISGACVLLSLLFWGWYMDRFGSLAAVMVAYVVLLLIPLCYGFGSSIGWLYMAGAFSGISVSGIDLGYINATLMFAEPGMVVQYEAVHSSFFGLRGTIAPLVSIRLLLLLSHTNRLHQADWRRGYLMCFAIMACGVICQAVSMRSYRAAAVEALRNARS